MNTVDLGWFVTLAAGFGIGYVFAHREAIADWLASSRWLCGDEDERPVVYPQSHPAVRVLQRGPYDHERDV